MWHINFSRAFQIYKYINSEIGFENMSTLTQENGMGNCTVFPTAKTKLLHKYFLFEKIELNFLTG